MAFIHKLFTSYKELGDTSTYVGSLNRIWYDSTNNSLRISDGVTPGGIAITATGGGGGTTNLSAVAQNIIPSADATYSLGSPSKRWSSVFLSSGTVHLGDVAIESRDGKVYINSVPLATVSLTGSYNDLTNKPTLLKGDTGLQGIKGDKGDQGIPGNNSTVAGPKGDTGAQGVSLNILGTVATVADLDIRSIGWTSDNLDQAYLVTATGDLWFWSVDNTWANAGHIVGPQGDKGDTGSTGAKGDQGAQGNVGAQGEQGDKGDKGDAGDQGTPGNIGPQGSTGEKGDTGDQGIQGIQGIKGDKGDTGSTGAKGDKGDTGSTGAKGDKGDTGEKGDQGDPGVTELDRLTNNGHTVQLLSYGILQLPVEGAGQAIVGLSSTAANQDNNGLAKSFKIDVNGSNWYFDKNGTLVFPDTTTVANGFISGGTDNHTTGISNYSGNNQIYVQDANIGIQTSADGDTYNTWTFRNDGQFLLPQVTIGGITAGYVTSEGNIGFNANGNLWKFGSDGTMLSPYNVQITTTGLHLPTSWRVGSDAAYISNDWFANTNDLNLHGTEAIYITEGDTAQWQFSGGNLTVPGIIQNGSTLNYIDFDDQSVSHELSLITTNDNYVNIKVGINSSNRVWQFGTDGKLTLPTGGDIFRDGVSVLGSGSLDRLTNGSHSFTLGSDGYPRIGTFDGVKPDGLRFPRGRGAVGSYLVQGTDGIADWANPPGIIPTISIMDMPPYSGDNIPLWFNTADSRLYVYNGTVWVDANPQVAVPVDYNDLDNLPVLFSGNYTDLTNKPALFDGDYNSLTNKPTVIADSASPPVTTSLWYNTDDGRTYTYYNNVWVDIAPQIVQDTFSGSYLDLTDVPTTTGDITFNNTIISTTVNELISLSGSHSNGVTLASDEWAQLLWVPDITTATIDDLGNGGDHFSWVYTSGESNNATVYITTKLSGEDSKQWEFRSDGTTQFPRYTFPAADGTANQVLKTDGNGHLTWTTVSGGLNLQDYPNNIFINGEGKGLIVDAGGDKRFGFMKYSGIEGTLVHTVGDTKQVPLRIGRVNTDDVTTAISSNLTTEIYIATNGYVGIGDDNTSPQARLDVNGAIISHDMFINTKSTRGALTSILTTGFDPNFQLASQNGSTSNDPGTEVSRFGIIYDSEGFGWDSFTQYNRGSAAQNGHQVLYSSNTGILKVSFDGINLIQGSITFPDSSVQTTAYNGNYTPALLSSWSGTPPSTVAEALDRIAALLKTLNSDVGA